MGPEIEKKHSYKYSASFRIRKKIYKLKMRDFDRYIHFPDLWKYDYACMFIQGFSGLKANINKFRSCKFSLIYAY